MFKKILIIDDDARFNFSLQKNIETSLETDVSAVKDLDEKIEDLLEYDLYIIRLDDKTVDIITKLTDEDKFVILITKQDNKETREKILSYNVSDYVVTNSRASVDFVSKIVKRLYSNSKKTILIVDDSKLVLTQMSILLSSQNMHVVQCSDGEEAWKHLENSNSKKIDLVITDYEMPKLNGYELVKMIRAKYSFEELPLLVVSGSEDTYMISRFLKVGANDYITKPFINEEFMSRINNSLLIADMFKKIKGMAMTDQLTGLHNRLYFYEAGVKVLENASRAGQHSSIAMIDIDDFKSVNDTYGHEVGDKALIHIANTIKKVLRRSDIFVRFGGEEFVILLPNCPNKQAIKVMQKVCKSVAKTPLELNSDKNLRITISIGVTSILKDVDAMLETADKYMYEAKKSGKNRVVSKD
ncbi:diguanylate cyclase [Sulfurimonas sp. SAG-AH-194-L11]|nr:diguanylate cyclase [Sulfurimonas sp. SAG-AH-194-L11]MDF1876697.1 diguanylate cyclase [Sulfurimonas sp. SAG-AH-194-L11]